MNNVVLTGMVGVGGLGFAILSNTVRKNKLVRQYINILPMVTSTLQRFCTILPNAYSKLLIALIIFFFSPASYLYALPPFNFSQVVIEKSQKEYGSDSVNRLIRWQNVVINGKLKDDQKKLESVNRFINTIPFAEDIEHWQAEDHWATPYELVVSNGGDCEDYAIAKYFTLRAMGVEKDRIRIAYVRIREKKLPHMVLLYFPKKEEVPVVLDNLEENIVPLHSRKGMELIYSVNEEYVWINVDGNFFTLAGESSTIHRWNSIVQRINDDN